MSEIIGQEDDPSKEAILKKSTNYVELLKKFNKKKKETKMQAEKNQGQSLFSFLNATIVQFSM